MGGRKLDGSQPNFSCPFMLARTYLTICPQTEKAKGSKPAAASRQRQAPCRQAGGSMHAKDDVMREVRGRDDAMLEVRGWDDAMREVRGWDEAMREVRARQSIFMVDETLHAFRATALTSSHDTV